MRASFAVASVGKKTKGRKLQPRSRSKAILLYRLGRPAVATLNFQSKVRCDLSSRRKLCAFRRGAHRQVKPRPACAELSALGERDSFAINLHCRSSFAGPSVREKDSNLVDPASSHTLVSKIKPCMSKYKQLYCETANGSLYQL